MLNALSSSRVLDALGRQHFDIAVREIDEKFSDDFARRPMATRLHETIAQPLQSALLAGRRATLIAKSEGREWDWYFVQLGEQAFPMRARKRDWNVPTELQLFPPLPAKKLDWNKIERDGNRALYGRELQEVDRISLFREQGPTTHVRFNESDVDLNRPYGWALWEASAGLIRRATKLEDLQPEKTTEFDPVLAIERSTRSMADPYGKVARQLLNSIDTQKEIPFTAGPQPADDLLAACSWRGKPVAVTSTRPVKTDGEGAEQAPLAVWTLEKHNGEMVWVDVPVPAQVKLPAHGAAVVLEGNTLHVIGGVDPSGDPLNSHYTYDLGAAARDRHRAEHWNIERPLEETVAWPAAIATERELFLSGGVAGYYTKRADQPEKLLSVRRDLRIYTGSSRRQRDALPIEDRGGSATIGKNCLFIGPGASNSGRVFAYDFNRDGALIELPKLPGAFGSGQLLFEGGSRLWYFGGTKSGALSKEIWELDLSDLQGDWTKLGESSFAAGPTRLVEAYGKVLALMVAPGKSACYHLDLGSPGAPAP